MDKGKNVPGLCTRFFSEQKPSAITLPIPNYLIFILSQQYNFQFTNALHL